ncbi:MAG: type IV secretory system conjugative DNA transfer family protein [Bacillota bacterium]
MRRVLRVVLGVCVACAVVGVWVRSVALLCVSCCASAALVVLSGQLGDVPLWAGIGAVYVCVASLCAVVLEGLAVRWMASLGRVPYLTVSDAAAVRQGALLAPYAVGLLVLLGLRPGRGPARQRTDEMDVVIGYANGPVVIKRDDRYLHTLVTGTTGTGKTSRVLKPMIWQDLQALKRGCRLGVTVVEPKGDLAQDVYEMCRDLEIPCTFVNPEWPGTATFNPLEGDAETAAEIMRTVLVHLFGRQEAFFRANYELAARNIVLLLKYVKGDDVTVQDLIDALRDYRKLEAYMKRLEAGPAERSKKGVADYFRVEVLENEKSRQFLMGLRLTLEDLTGNSMLRRVLCAKSDVDLDRHLEQGGVLVVNTAMGPLGRLGDAFGQFFILHFQQAVFRRQGTERTRTPHVLYVDEFPRYVNADFERLLAIGRSYRCAAVLALQTTAQVVLDEKRTFREVMVENTRNKIILNPGTAEEAKYLAAQLGEYERVEKQKSYTRQGTFIFPWYAEGYREAEKREARYPYTELMELPKFCAVVRVVRDGEPLPPLKVRLELCEWDRKRAARHGPAGAGRLEVKGVSGQQSGLRVKVRQNASDGFYF